MSPSKIRPLKTKVKGGKPVVIISLYTKFIFKKSYHMWSLIYSQQTDYKSHLKNSCRMFYIDVHKILLDKVDYIPLHKIQCILFIYILFIIILINKIDKRTAIS